MHILHLTPYYPPAWAFGPTPAHVAALARAQAAHGHQVTVLTTDAMAPHERVHPGDAEVEGVRVVRVRNVSGSTRTWLGCSTPVGMRRAARALPARSVDVVHLHELVTVEGLRVLPVLDARVPLVVSLHGQLREPARVSPWAIRLWHAFGGRALCARLAAVVASSDEEAAHARASAAAICARLADTLVIPDGMDVDDWAAGVSRLRTDSGDTEQMLLLDARGARPGDARAIVHAFALVRRETGSAHLVVIGPESPAIGEARHAARALELDAHVTWAGYLPLPRMREWLNRADALLLPAGVPGPEALAIEALARGVMVLTTGGSLPLESAAVRRVLHDEGWLDALRQVLDRTGARGRRDAAGASVAPYGWSAVAERWLELYERLAQRTR